MFFFPKSKFDFEFCTFLNCAKSEIAQTFKLKKNEKKHFPTSCRGKNKRKKNYSYHKFF